MRPSLTQLGGKVPFEPHRARPHQTTTTTTSTTTLEENLKTVSPSMNTARGVTKICRVCGDVALGFNFNGLSCESCKAFFRRNAFKRKALKCKKVGNCHIEITNRKGCKLCRLDKCYQIGMKKELIIIQGGKCLPENILLSKDLNLGKDRSLPHRSPSPSVYLPVCEMERFREITDAMSGAFCDDTQLEVVGTVGRMFDGFNQAGYYVKNICTFCKHVPPFMCLPLADQILILKSFFFDILAVRYAFTYQPTTDRFPIAENEAHDRVLMFPMQILDQWKDPEIVHTFRQYHTSVQREMEGDTNIRDLVIAQCLFSKENTTCPEFMKYQYYVYNRLLRLYLYGKYRDSEKVEEKYSTLMSILKEGEVIRKIIEDIYASMDLNEIQPVIAELYNLL